MEMIVILHIERSHYVETMGREKEINAGDIWKNN